MPRSVRVAARVVLVGGVAFLAFVLMQYDASLAMRVINGIEARLRDLGAPAPFTAPGRVEFVLNVAMFVPVVFLAALGFPRVRWGSWVACAFLGVCLLELVQGVLLPPRSAEFEDVVANTLGAVVGAVAALPVKRSLARRRTSGAESPEGLSSSSDGRARPR